MVLDDVGDGERVSVSSTVRETDGVRVSDEEVE